MRITASHVCLGVLLAAFANLTHAQTCGQWLPEGHLAGVSAPVDAAVTWDHDGDDSTTEVLVVSGPFRAAGAAQANGVAYWDGSDWHPLGATYSLGYEKLVVFQGMLHGLSGSQVARWTGDRWEVVGQFSGPTVNSKSVYCGLAHESGLLIGGSFNAVNGQSLAYLARWDGRTWSSVFPAATSPVTALAADERSLYAATYSAATRQNTMLSMERDGWRQLGPPSGTLVQSIVIYRGQPWAVRPITAGPFPSWVSYWDGAAWRAPSTIVPSGVESIAVVGNQLVVTGSMSMPTRKSEREGVLTLDQANWRSLMRIEQGVIVRGVVEFRGETVAYGAIPVTYGQAARHIVVRRGAGWEPLNPGVSHAVNAITPWMDGVAVGGEGSVSVNHSGTWVQLGQRLGGTVTALASFDGSLYAGGSISSTTPSMPAGSGGSGLARFNGTSWEGVDALGARYIRDLFVVNGHLIACGRQPNAQIRLFDGTHWSEAAGMARNTTGVGSTSDAAVNQVCAFNGHLIFAGRFNLIGDIEAAGVARWDGASWVSMDAGLPKATIGYGVAHWNDRLVLSSSAGMREWDGTTWVPITGWPVSFKPLTVHNGELFGRDYEYGRLYRYSAQGWQTLGAGFAPAVQAVESIGGDLWVGFGAHFDFPAGTAVVDGRVLGVVARWSDVPLLPSVDEGMPAVRVRRGTTLVLNQLTPRGTGPFTYQWYHHGRPMVADGAIEGRIRNSNTTSRHLVIDQVRDAAAGEYQLEVTGPCGATRSSPVVVSITCGGDFDGDGFAGYDDLIQYLHAWFNRLPLAEHDGLPFLNTGDLFAFLREYLAGCP